MKVNGSHHGDNPLLTPTRIQIVMILSKWVIIEKQGDHP